MNPLRLVDKFSIIVLNRLKNDDIIIVFYNIFIR